MNKLIIIFLLSFISIQGYSQVIQGSNKVTGGKTNSYTFYLTEPNPLSTRLTLSVSNGQSATISFNISAPYTTKNFSVTWNNVNGTGNLKFTNHSTGTVTNWGVTITKDCSNTNISENITSSKDFSGCTVTMSGTTISNNAKVNINATDRITLSPNTTIREGSTVIMKIVSSLSRADERELIEEADWEELEIENLTTGMHYLQSTELLSQNSPNPFNGSTFISCYVPEETNKAILRVVNIQGQTVETIPLIEKGFNVTEIEGENLIPGIYIYSLIIDDAIIDTKRMLISR